MFAATHKGLRPTMIYRKNKELERTLTRECAGQGSVNVQSPNIDAFDGRMNLLIAHFKDQGGAAEIARRCGFSEGVIRSWAKGSSDPSRARCIQLAEGTGASLLWLVAGQGPTWAADAASGVAESPAQYQSHLLRGDLLTMAVELIDSELERAGKVLPLEKRVAAYGLIYEELLEPGELPSAKIVQLVIKAVA